MRISDWSSDVCSSDLAAADNLEDRYRQQSDAARAAAQKAVQAAKDKAARGAEKRLAKVDSDLAGKMAAAEADVAAARTSAMAEIESVAAEAAGDLVAKLSGVTVAAGDAKAAVQAGSGGAHVSNPGTTSHHI